MPARKGSIILFSMQSFDDHHYRFGGLSHSAGQFEVRGMAPSPPGVCFDMAVMRSRHGGFLSSSVAAVEAVFLFVPTAKTKKTTIKQRNPACRMALSSRE